VLREAAELRSENAVLRERVQLLEWTLEQVIGVRPPAAVVVCKPSSSRTSRLEEILNEEVAPNAPMDVAFEGAATEAAVRVEQPTASMANELSQRRCEQSISNRRHAGRLFPGTVAHTQARRTLHNSRGPPGTDAHTDASARSSVGGMLSPTAVPGRLFLSYRVTSDAELVERLHDKLRSINVDVWWDRVCLLPGQPWEEGFADGLLSSDISVPFLSKAALAPFASLEPTSRCDNVHSHAHTSHGHHQVPIPRPRAPALTVGAARVSLGARAQGAWPAPGDMSRVHRRGR
jgi:hypothetical protein